MIGSWVNNYITRYFVPTLCLLFIASRNKRKNNKMKGQILRKYETPTLKI